MASEETVQLCSCHCWRSLNNEIINQPQFFHLTLFVRFLSLSYLLLYFAVDGVAAIGTQNIASVKGLSLG